MTSAIGRIFPTTVPRASRLRCARAPRCHPRGKTVTRRAAALLLRPVAERFARAAPSCPPTTTTTTTTTTTHTHTLTATHNVELISRAFPPRHVGSWIPAAPPPLPHLGSSHAPPSATPAVLVRARRIVAPLPPHCCEVCPPR